MLKAQQQNETLQTLKIGDKVCLFRCPEFKGEIVDGPLLNGGDWVVQWEGLMESDEFNVDLVKLGGERIEK